MHLPWRFLTQRCPCIDLCRSGTFSAVIIFNLECSGKSSSVLIPKTDHLCEMIQIQWPEKSQSWFDGPQNKIEPSMWIRTLMVQEAIIGFSSADCLGHSTNQKWTCCQLPNILSIRRKCLAMFMNILETPSWLVLTHVTLFWQQPAANASGHQFAQWNVV